MPKEISYFSPKEKDYLLKKIKEEMSLPLRNFFIELDDTFWNNILPDRQEYEELLNLFPEALKPILDEESPV